MDTELTHPTRVLFIGGTGRCGTNLIKDLLSEHADIASLPFEYRFTLDPHGIIDCYQTLHSCWSPYMAHSKISELEELLIGMASKSYPRGIKGKIIKTIDPEETRQTSPPYADWELEKWFPNYSTHVQQMLNALKSYTYKGSWPGEKNPPNNGMHFTRYPDESKAIFRNFMRSLFNDLLRQNNKMVFVEDNTWNVLYCRELKAILPEAKFLHMVRDPRDVVASLTQQRWAPEQLDLTISYYSSLMEKIIESSASVPQSDMINLKLEELVKNPNSNLNLILDACGLDLLTGKIKKDLSHSHSGRWMNEFDEREQNVLSKRTEKYGSYFNYDFSA